MAGKLSLWLYILVLIWIGLGVLCLYIPPDFFWPAGFVAYSLPAPLILNLLFLLYWALKFSPRAFMPLGLCVALFGLYSRSFHPFPTSGTADAEALKVMSFNVRGFRVYPETSRTDASKEFVNFVAGTEADIICIQEYYNSKKRLKSKEKLLKRYPYYSASLSDVNRIGSEYGMAIFSRYPIINKGTIAFGELTSNHAMFADIALKQDTVRVYNFHLQSMKISDDIIPEINDNKDNLKIKTGSLYSRLRRGFVARSKQIRQLRGHIDSSPYPVIAAGDLNDLPHSYTYQYLRRELQNSFEEAGSGLGATFAGFLPFLRIDNQFASKKIQVLDFAVLDSVRYSDHHPTFGTYSFKK